MRILLSRSQVRIWLSLTAMGLAGAASPVQTGPAAPTGLAATALSGFAVRLSWADNRINETGFGIWRKDTGGAWARIGVARAAAISFIDWGLGPNSSYDYRFRAHNNSGASAWSNEVRATTLNVPAAPGSLQAGALSSTEVRLTWVDNSGNETGFGIWRKSGSADWARIGVAAPDSSTFLDRGLTPGLAYQYRIRSHNSVGASAWSNEATGIPVSSPTISHAAPATAHPGGETRVTLQFTFPIGYTLARNPSVRVISSSGELTELLPTFITQPVLDGAGFRDLHSGNYPRGTYFVSAEVEYVRPDGQMGMVGSNWTLFEVP
jgi:hypothetical protein